MTGGTRERRHVLLVGEDFGGSGDQYLSDRYALTGQSGRRVAELAGLQFPVEYARVFERTNVVRRAGDWHDKALVQAGAAALAERMLTEQRVILLGRRVAAALGALDIEMLEWTRWRVSASGVIVAPSTLVARVPHPSGRNRWWNESSNVQKAAAFLRDAATWATET